MDSATRWKLARMGLTTVSLYGGWLLFSWSLAPASLMVGAVFAVGVASLTYSVFIDRSEAQRRSLLPRPHAAVLFLLVLVLRMYLSSFRVAVMAVTGRIDPGVVHFRTRLRSDIARVLLANAITTTPGTLTLELDDDHLIVHCLEVRTRHSRRAGELVMGPFERLLRRVFV